MVKFISSYTSFLMLCTSAFEIAVANLKRNDKDNQDLGEWSNACKYHSSEGTYYNLENIVENYMPLGRQQETVFSLQGTSGLQTLVFNFC